jgi:hypothetical protein
VWLSFAAVSRLKAGYPALEGPLSRTGPPSACRVEAERAWAFAAKNRKMKQKSAAGSRGSGSAAGRAGVKLEVSDCHPPEAMNAAGRVKVQEIRYRRRARSHPDLGQRIHQLSPNQPNHFMPPCMRKKNPDMTLNSACVTPAQRFIVPSSTHPGTAIGPDSRGEPTWSGPNHPSRPRSKLWPARWRVKRGVEDGVGATRSETSVERRAIPPAERRDGFYVLCANSATPVPDRTTGGTTS